MLIHPTLMYARFTLACYLYFLVVLSLHAIHVDSEFMEDPNEINFDNEQIQRDNEMDTNQLSNFNGPESHVTNEWTSQEDAIVPSSFDERGSLEQEEAYFNTNSRNNRYLRPLPSNPGQPLPPRHYTFPFPRTSQRSSIPSHVYPKPRVYLPQVGSEVEEVPYQEEMQEWTEEEEVEEEVEDNASTSTIPQEYEGPVDERYDFKETESYPNDINLAPYSNVQQSSIPMELDTSTLSTSHKKKKKKKKQRKKKSFVPRTMANQVYRNCDAGAWSHQLNVIQTLYRKMLTLFQTIPDEVFSKQSFHANVQANFLSSLTLFKGVYYLHTGQALLHEFQRHLQMYCPQVPKTNHNGIQSLKHWSEWMASLYSTWLQRESVQWVMNLIESRIKEYDMVFQVYLPELERMQQVYQDLSNFAEIVKEIQSTSNHYWYSYEHEWQAGLTNPGQKYAQYLGRVQCIHALVQRLLIREDMKYFPSNKLFQELCDFFFQSVKTIAIPNSSFQLNADNNNVVFQAGTFTKWKHTMISNTKIEC